MERFLLVTLLLIVWSIVYLTGKVMPQYSSVILLLIFMTLYAWLLTLALVHRKRQELKYPKPINTSYVPKISIVVAAHNEESVIEQTVRNLLKLEYPYYDIWVIDDRSTDQTPFILKKLHEELKNQHFHYYIRPHDSLPGKSAVLNDAISLTSGEVLCVFDADAYVEPDFLRKIVPFLADENVGAVQARKVIANAGTNWLTRCQNYEYSLDAHYQSGRDSIMGAVELRGNGQLVKRIALEEVQGWNNYTLTDDLDLSTRLHLSGWDIRFAHKVLVYEEGITRIGPLLRQRRRWTEGTLVRYMEHFTDLLTSRKSSLRVTADMLAYLAEFMLPIMVVFDAFQLGYSYFIGDASKVRLISSLIILPIFFIFTSSTLVVAIIRFNRPGFWHALQWAIITGLYMVYLWVPLVFLIVVKVLFQKERNLQWAKTDHSGAAHQTLPNPYSPPPSL